MRRAFVHGERDGYASDGHAPGRLVDRIARAAQPRDELPGRATHLALRLATCLHASTAGDGWPDRQSITLLQMPGRTEASRDEYAIDEHDVRHAVRHVKLLDDALHRRAAVDVEWNLVIRPHPSVVLDRQIFGQVGEQLERDLHPWCVRCSVDAGAARLLGLGARQVRLPPSCSTGRYSDRLANSLSVISTPGACAVQSTRAPRDCWAWALARYASLRRARPADIRTGWRTA